MTHREEKREKEIRSLQLQQVSPGEYLHDQSVQLVTQKKFQLLHEMS